MGAELKFYFGVVVKQAVASLLKRFPAWEERKWFKRPAAVNGFTVNL